VTCGKLLDGLSDLVVKLFLALSGSIQAISSQLSLVITSLLGSSNVFPSLTLYSRIVQFLDLFLLVGIGLGLPEEERTNFVYKTSLYNL